MSKKNKEAQKKNKEDQAGYKEAKVVIIGETFTSLLDPLTIDTPCLLLPICGIPIIEFMLNSLSSAKEIFICINKHKKQLKNYLEKYHKKQLNYKIIYNNDFKNVGDCLKQIKQENYISSDFILIRGLTILNSDFEELFNSHLKNKKLDHNCALTSIMKKYKTTNEIRTYYDDNILIYNENTKKIYQFEPTNDKKKVEIFKGIIIENSKDKADNNLIVRSDLIETGVDICTHNYLEKMTVNDDLKHDFQSIRDSVGKILSEEIYEDTFYLEELNQDAYCGLIRNVESYLRVNFEMLNRWAYPIVIDNIDMNSKLGINLKQMRLSLYSDKDANSENFRKADLFSEVVILNKENTIGKECKLRECILCKDVQVGEKCELYNCIIFKGTKIENNVIIKNSILGQNCVIKSGIKIISSILGSNVELDKDSIKKRIYLNEEGTLCDIEKETFLQNLEKSDKLNLANNSIYGFLDQDLINEEKNKNIETIPKNEEFYSDEEDEQDKEEEETFQEGVEDIINSGKEKGKTTKDITNEIWNLRNDKISSNPTLEETLKISLAHILNQFLNGKKFVGNKQNAKELIKLFNNWKPLFDKFVPDDNIELKLISVLEQICIEIKEINNSFHILLKILNGQCHLIKDKTLINWNDNEESCFETNEGTIEIDKDVNKKNKKDMEDYIDDLKNNEEEEEEDDDDN